MSKVARESEQASVHKKPPGDDEDDDNRGLEPRSQDDKIGESDNMLGE